MTEFPQLEELRTEMSEDVAAAQRDAIGAALRARPRRRRGWLGGLVVAVIVAGPLGAVASDDAVPGDALYPVKRIVEPVIAIFDRDVVVEHRVEEAEQLTSDGARRSVVDAAIDDADEAIAHSVGVETDRYRDRLRALRASPPPPAVDDPVETTLPTDRAPEPRTTTTPPTTDGTTTTRPSDTATSTRPVYTTTTTTTVTDRTTTTHTDDRPRDG